MKNRRIWIFGTTGTGKTTFAKRLSEKTKIPFYSTDDIMYKKKWTKRYSREERKVKLDKISKNKSWIIEGVHTRGWPEYGIKKADILIFLNISLVTIFARIIKRENKAGFFSIIKLFWYAIDGKIKSCDYKRFRKLKSQFVPLNNQRKINKFLENFGK